MTEIRQKEDNFAWNIIFIDTLCIGYDNLKGVLASEINVPHGYIISYSMLWCPLDSSLMHYGIIALIHRVACHFWVATAVMWVSYNYSSSTPLVWMISSIIYIIGRRGLQCRVIIWHNITEKMATFFGCAALTKTSSVI